MTCPDCQRHLEEIKRLKKQIHSLRDQHPGPGVDEAYARNTDPHTSKQAAERVDPGPLELATYLALADHPLGLTTKEIADMLDKEWTSITPRMKPLERKGLVEYTGEDRDNRKIWRAVTPFSETFTW